MTPFQKARALRRLFYSALPLFFATFLLVVLTQSKLALLAFIPVIALPWIVFLVAKQWPACPTCGTQLIEETEGSGQATAGRGFSVKLDPPKRECGYCGQDLTLSPAED